MDLTNKAYANIRLLRNLQPEETVNGSRFHLMEDDTNNDSDKMLRNVESVIHFTFHQLFFSLRRKALPPKKVYYMLEESIMNIYENEQMKNFMKDKQFNEMVKDIDSKVSLLNEYHWFESPFYPFFEKMYELKERLYKMYYEFEEYNKTMYGSVYMSDSDEEIEIEEDDEEVEEDEEDKEVEEDEEDEEDEGAGTGVETPASECEGETSSEDDGEKLEIPAEETKDETSRGIWAWH